MSNTKCPRCGGVNLKWSPHRAIGCSDCGWENLPGTTEWNAQIGGGKYAIQFETTSREHYKLVEKACQSAVDRRRREVVRERMGAEARPDRRAGGMFSPHPDDVRVVRCKDCKHWTADGEGNPWCHMWERYQPHEDVYCCFGERRADHA